MATVVLLEKGGAYARNFRTVGVYADLVTALRSLKKGQLPWRKNSPAEKAFCHRFDAKGKAILKITDGSARYRVRLMEVGS